MMSEFVKLCCDYLLVVESFGSAVDSGYHCYLGGGHYGGGVTSLQLVDKACGPAGLINVVGGRISWLKVVCLHFL